MDTNAVIDFLGKVLPQTGAQIISKQDPVISAVTYIEGLGWPSATPQQLAPVAAFMKIARILLIDQEAIEKTIALRQQKKMKLGDAIIAATALVNDLTLITRNMADFDAIPGLRLLDPWNI